MLGVAFSAIREAAPTGACPDGLVGQGGACFVPPRDGFACTGTACEKSKDVREATGKSAPDACPADKVLQDGSCYDPPRDNYKCQGTTCFYDRDLKPATKITRP